MTGDRARAGAGERFAILSCLARAAALLLALLSLSLVVPAASQPNLELLSQGRRLAEAGRFSDALQSFFLFKQQNPDDVRSYLYSAQTMIAAGRNKDAALELDEAASRQPQAGTDLLEYARARDQLGHLREAARVLSEAEDSPLLPTEGLWLLADIYYRLKEAKNAQRVLDKFALRQPDDPRLKLRRGQVYIYLEEFENALTSLEEWVWANPYSAEGHFEMARTLRYGNNPEAAKRSALKAVELAPNNPEYRHMVGIICDSLKQHAEAVRHLEKAAASPQAFTRIYFDLGNALRRAGETAKAQEALARYRELYTAEEAAANDSKKVEALINQGQLQIQSGAVTDALGSLSRVLEVEPDNWLAHSFLAKLYLSGGLPASAKPHLDQLERIDPNSSEGTFLNAFYWYERRDYSKALEFAKRSKDLRPGDAELRNLLGNIHFAQGNLEVATAEYAAATALAPDRFDFKANYQTAKRKLGEY